MTNVRELSDADEDSARRMNGRIDALHGC